MTQSQCPNISSLQPLVTRFKVRKITELGSQRYKANKINTVINVYKYYQYVLVFFNKSVQSKFRLLYMSFVYFDNNNVPDDLCEIHNVGCSSLPPVNSSKAGAPKNINVYMGTHQIILMGWTNVDRSQPGTTSDVRFFSPTSVWSIISLQKTLNFSPHILLYQEVLICTIHPIIHMLVKIFMSQK